MANDEPHAPVGKDGGHGRRVLRQAPWSRRGWYTDEYYASRDAALDKKVEAAGKGLNPYGYYEDRPGLAISPVMHNPYFAFGHTVVFAWLGFFLLGKLGETGWPTYVLAIFCEIVALLALVMGALRIPGWHHARKIAKAHVAAHGGTFPPELRWYT